MDDWQHRGGILAWRTPFLKQVVSLNLIKQLSQALRVCLQTTCFEPCSLPKQNTSKIWLHMINSWIDENLWNLTSILVSVRLSGWRPACPYSKWLKTFDDQTKCDTQCHFCNLNGPLYMLSRMCSFPPFAYLICQLTLMGSISQSRSSSGRVNCLLKRWMMDRRPVDFPAELHFARNILRAL